MELHIGVQYYKGSASNLCNQPELLHPRTRCTWALLSLSGNIASESPAFCREDHSKAWVPANMKRDGIYHISTTVSLSMPIWPDLSQAHTAPVLTDMVAYLEPCQFRRQPQAHCAFDLLF